VWEDWRRFGGLDTLASYGLDRQLLYGAGASPGKIRDAFLAALPQRHYDFLTALPSSYACGDYYFVHAGARPGIPLGRQVDADQLWIRDEFLIAGNAFGGRVVVHGHTPTAEPERHPFRLGLDTGAYMSGRLTAVKLHGADVTFLQS
jgi:serine/threonine protein phosphatase 1